MREEDFVRLRDVRLGVPAAGGRPGGGFLRVLQAWCQLVRPPLAERATPCGWLDGVLTLEVNEARWLASLELLAPVLRDEINGWIGAKCVKEVRLRAAGTGGA